ncbi:MAG: formylglycine-generating enzyme family protein [Planctomycetia bacterium]|nr:formylglycine-generating enzyme family protein [Planctomycetia bacterium]
MFTKMISGMLAGMVLSWTFAMAQDGPYDERVWTDKKGRQITGSWDPKREEKLRDAAEGELDYSLPIVRSQDKKKFLLSLEKLSLKDKKFVLKTREAAAAHEESEEDDPFATAPVGKKGASKKSKSSRAKGGDRVVCVVRETEFAFRWCPPGVLMVPGANGRPMPQRINKGFWMLETEVTQQQWKALMGENPAHFSSDTTRPVEQVNWFDANAFCRRLGAEMNVEVALPSTLQWSYACCAGQPVAAVMQNVLEKAWIKGNSDGKTHAVAQLQPNAWGIYDMLGNVWEWSAECHDARKRPVPPTAAPAKEISAMHCGASWYNESINLGKPSWREADQRIFDVGFRCCTGDDIRNQTQPAEK